MGCPGLGYGWAPGAAFGGSGWPVVIEIRVELRRPSRKLKRTLAVRFRGPAECRDGPLVHSVCASSPTHRSRTLRHKRTTSAGVFFPPLDFPRPLPLEQEDVPSRRQVQERAHQSARQTENNDANKSRAKPNPLGMQIIVIDRTKGTPFWEVQLQESSIQVLYASRADVLKHNTLARRRLIPSLPNLRCKSQVRDCTGAQPNIKPPANVLRVKTTTKMPPDPRRLRNRDRPTRAVTSVRAHHTVGRSRNSWLH